MNRQSQPGRAPLALSLVALLCACNANRLGVDCPPEDPNCAVNGDGGGGGGGGGDNHGKAGPGSGDPFDPKSPGSGGVKTDPKGNIILDPGNIAGSMKPIIWVANSAEGTVSKVDTRTLKELARYYTHPGGKADPSRTTVNLSGDVVVANRAAPDGNRASAVKIAGDESGCVDRNGNGKIDTSRDSTAVPWPEGQPVSPDECVLWITKLTPDSLPRAAGWNAESGEFGQQVYIGLFTNKQLVRLDGRDGKILTTINLTYPNQPGAGVMPYGLVLDKDGNVWIRGAEGSLGKVAAKNGDGVTVYAGPKAPPCPYGIAADSAGRIYTAGGSCVSRFTPATETWERLDLAPQGASSLRGLAVDQNSGVWIADTNDGMFHVDGAAAAMVFKGKAPVPNGGNVGAAIDFDNIPWIISLSHSTAYKINPMTYATQPAKVGSGPYTYSDMTGFQLRNAGAPSGKYVHTFLGCTDGSEARWTQLDYQLSAPPNTKVVIRVRYAPGKAGLDTAPWMQVATIPSDMPPIKLRGQGNAMQVEFSMQSPDKNVTPILSGLDVAFKCAGLG